MSNPQAEDNKAKHEKLMSEMKVGESFFIENVKPCDLGYVRRLGYKLKIRLSIRFVLEDQIYGKMGTRVMRQADYGTVAATGNTEAR